MNKNDYDVLIIGSGHAGVEAAHAAAKLGCKTLLLTLDLDSIGKLSCNPAIGGVAKGHLVREVDALGGLMGKITDLSAVSYRILNRSKGKAVWSSRAQVDRYLYPKVARNFLENTENLNILQAKVKNILVKNKKVCGVETNFGEFFSAKAVVGCAGTFLKSTIHIGLDSFSGGRLNEESSDELFDSIKKCGHKLRHFKTGTCARLDKRSIDFSKMEEQFPDYDASPFSFTTASLPDKQMSCFITHTNKKTHKIILKSLKYSPLYTGKIKARGVRYCPSLEDKIVKFGDKERHQVFIEPEGFSTIEVYPNGVSTSLPFAVQQDFIRTIAGLENAIILKPGYGIEHGLIYPQELDATLESKKIGGLYFAGQVNGTTGYEEAAAQGLLAGINAGQAIKRKKPFVLSRDQSYIGVLLDDLTTKGTDEPYRMFTSRAEFRLTLRESNSDLRLVPLGVNLGLQEKSALDYVKDKISKIETQCQLFKTTKITLGDQKVSLYDYLKRPNIAYNDAQKHLAQKITNLMAQYEVEITAKYESFISREQGWLKELQNLSRIKLPNIDYSKVASLSKEVVEKLNKFKPENLGEALKISGVTPAAALSVYNYLKSKKH